MQANKTADNQYLIPLMDGIIENIDIADGILLTTSEFVSQEDIEMTTTHDDLSLFQISFCIDGNMEWSYINNEVVHQFQIAAQQSQVRYGTFKECRSRISGNRKFKGISITLDEKIFEQIFTCIKIRGALYDTRKTAPVRVYAYTPNISKILSEILVCHFCDEMKKLYLQGKIFELIAVYCDEVICKSPTNDFGIRIIQNQPYAPTRQRMKSYRIVLFNDGHYEVKLKYRDEMEELLLNAALWQKEAQRYA